MAYIDGEGHFRDGDPGGIQNDMDEVDLSEGPDMYWTTREGKRIYIPNLENGHLVNIIKMLRRNAPRMRFMDELAIVTGPRPSGEMAQECFDEGVREMCERDDEGYLLEEYPQYENLLSEARDRKLTF